MGSENWLRITTPISGGGLRSNAASRIPSSVWVGGMRMSASTTSGTSRSQTSTSESKSLTAATISMPGSLSSRRRRPSRTIRLSSPSATRTMVGTLAGRPARAQAVRPRLTSLEGVRTRTSDTGAPGGAGPAPSPGSGHKTASQGGVVSTDQLDEMGPIDYIVIEWPGKQPVGDAVPLLLDLVDRGTIRILDIAFMDKDEDAAVGAIDLAAHNGGEPGFEAFEGAASGLIGDDDMHEAAEALAPGTSAALLVWENRWAAPVAVAVRRSGGQLVASGRLEIQAILAALDAVEATN